MSRPPATTFEYLQFHAANTPDRVALIMDDGEYTYGPDCVKTNRRRNLRELRFKSLRLAGNLPALKGHLTTWRKNILCCLRVLEFSHSLGRFADDALRFTKALADLGIERRQIVSIHHPHFYIEWLLTIACENLGAVSVSDDARNWKRANYLYQHVAVGLTNTPADEEPSFQYHCLTDDWVRATLRMNLAVAQKQPVIVPELDDLVRITRSSGSTGIPKLIPRTRRIQEYEINVRSEFCNHSYNSMMLITGSTFTLNWILLNCLCYLNIGAVIVNIYDKVKALHNYQITYLEDLPSNIERILDGTTTPPRKIATS